MVRIDGLPKELASVPERPEDWKRWREEALLWRVLMRDLIDRDLDARADALKLTADDPLYHQVLFGSYFEPRDRVGRPKGWHPAIPFYFQCLLVRWIQEVLRTIPGTPGALLGRGDGVVEKARDMTGSWSFINVIAHGWLFDTDFTAGLMSYKEDLVEKANEPGTLFYKLEGYLGLLSVVYPSRIVEIDGREIEVPVRSPEWLIPAGFDHKLHNQNLTLAHPSKSNVVSGFATTERAGTGTRYTMVVMDEAAKFQAFLAAWLGVRAVTDHAFALSSPDTRFGTGFRDVARQADEAGQTGGKGPAFIRLRAEEHPYRDEIWREEMEARHAGLDEAAESMAREFDLDYDAGSGAKIYPYAAEIQPAPLTYRPADHQLDFCIDPGIRDRCAFHVVMYDPGTDRYGLILSYANNAKPAEFYASLLVNRPLYQFYEYGPEEERVMEFFEKYRRNIRFWVGDPAGKAKVSGRDGKLTSFYDDLYNDVRRLTDGRVGIRIWSSDKHEYKRLEGRKKALRWLLQKLDINDAPDTRRTLAGIQDHRLPADRFDRERTSASEEPVRHPLHDRVVALEYYAVHRRHFNELQSEDPGQPVRVSMSGKPLSKSAHKRRGYIR